MKFCKRFASRRLVNARKMVTLPNNMTPKFEKLFMEKKKMDLLLFCDSEAAIDEVRRIAKYNGMPEVGKLYYTLCNFDWTNRLSVFVDVVFGVRNFCM
jgi:hypothetical protein